MVAEGMKKAYIIIDGPLHNQFTRISHIYMLWEMIQHIAMYNNTLHAITRHLITYCYMPLHAITCHATKLHHKQLHVITCHYTLHVNDVRVIT
jgi:hypothetical protein